MSAATLGFPKSERLKSRKKLQLVFGQGRKLYAGSIKILYILEPSSTPQLLWGVGVNGRYFKKAVDRNRIKRLLREAYRLQQTHLKQQVLSGSQSLSLFILFTGRTLPQYAQLFEEVGIGLEKLLNASHAVDSKNT